MPTRCSSHRLTVQHVSSGFGSNTRVSRLGCSFSRLDGPSQRALQRYIDLTQRREKFSVVGVAASALFCLSCPWRSAQHALHQRMLNLPLGAAKNCSSTPSQRPHPLHAVARDQLVSEPIRRRQTRPCRKAPKVLQQRAVCSNSPTTRWLHALALEPLIDRRAHRGVRVVGSSTGILDASDCGTTPRRAAADERWPVGIPGQGADEPSECPRKRGRSHSAAASGRPARCRARCSCSRSANRSGISPDCGTAVATQTPPSPAASGCAPPAWASRSRRRPPDARWAG